MATKTIQVNINPLHLNTFMDYFREQGELDDILEHDLRWHGKLKTT